MNLYKEGDYTPFGQKLRNVTLSDCWNQLMEQSNFELRRTAVDEFNKYAFSCLSTLIYSFQMSEAEYVFY